jgi:hypothetical protein
MSNILRIKYHSKLQLIEKDPKIILTIKVKKNATRKSAPRLTVPVSSLLFNTPSSFMRVPQPFYPKARLKRKECDGRKRIAVKHSNFSDSTVKRVV